MTTNDLRRALEQLAANHRWTWRPTVAAILRQLPTVTPGAHPVQAVAALDESQLQALLADDAVVASIGHEQEALDKELVSSVTDPQVIYYSPEFGISELVPQYSGGLGILAGDHLKASSDLGTSLAAIGLFYRQGFFRQQIGGDGQSERYETYAPVDFGCVDLGLSVEVPIADRTVVARVWRLDVGRIPLLLLDTDVPENRASDRAITDRLYSGGPRHRLEQELILGVGGARAVAAMGWEPGVHHLNEGHAGFLALELLDRARQAGTVALDEAVAAVRPHLLFTTHTPVPAGIDRFERDVIEPHLAPWAARWGDPVSSLLALGEDPDHGAKVFNMAALCLRLAASANGVSKLHGEVSRRLFADVPGGERIGSVTNGVHARTWVSAPLQELFDETLGDGWDRGEQAAWERVDELSGEAIIDSEATGREQLARLLLERMDAQLDRDACVVGFARRFATYKRATLLLRHPHVLGRLLGDDDRPLHIVFAGKAHPADEAGKALLREILTFATRKGAHGRFSFLPDYDMAVARAMYAGCDVWLNTPVRPHEASGTSGEKAALNGALNCSILDGWWAEMSDGRNGFDIATSDAETDDERDDQESSNALSVLAAIAVEFHADGTGAPSAAWLDRMRHGWRTLGPRVTAARMVSDYDRLLYTPMLAARRG